MAKITIRGGTQRREPGQPARPSAAPAVPFPCVHRGPFVRSLGLTLLCGCDQQVYRCGLPGSQTGECLRFRPPELQSGDRLRAAIAEQGIAVCQDCERRAALNEMFPFTQSGDGPDPS